MACLPEKLGDRPRTMGSRSAPDKGRRRRGIRYHLVHMEVHMNQPQGSDRMSGACGCDTCGCEPIPNESTVIAEVITEQARRTGETSDLPPLTDQERQDLLDEIEFDLL